MKQKNYDRYLLTEHVGEGAIMKIFDKVKGDLANFGDIVKSSAKLIGNDLGYLTKLVLSPSMMNMKKLKAAKEEHKRIQNQHLQALGTSLEKMEGNTVDAKINAFMFAPGLFCTSSAVNGVGSILSPDARSEIGSYGFDKMPLLGGFFSDEQGEESRQWEDLQSRIDAAKGDPTKQNEIFMSGFAGIMTGKDRKGAGGGGGSQMSGVTKLLYDLQSIFLIASHNRGNSVIYEGDEEKSSGEEFDFDKAMSNALADYFEENWPIDRGEYLKSLDTYYSQIIDIAKKRLEVVCTLGGTEDPEEFLAHLEKLNQIDVEGKDTPSIDVDKIKQGFTVSAEKIKSSEEEVVKIKKALGKKEDEEITEEEVNKQIGIIILSSFKAQFLQSLKEGLDDFYNAIYDEISAGIENEQAKIIKKTKYGGQFVKMMQKYQKEMGEEISKLEGS